MTSKVVVVQEAEKQLHEIDAWWVENRQSVPDLFLNELGRAFELLAEMPKIGPLFPRANHPGVRRLLLRKSKHWVYYVHDERRSIVHVLAIWSTFRGSDPPLSRPLK